MKDGQHKIHHSQRQRGSFEGSQRKISHSKIHHTQHEGRFPHKGVCHCMSILGKRRKLRDPIQDRYYRSGTASFAAYCINKYTKAGTNSKTTFDNILVLVQGKWYLRTRVLTIDTFQQPYRQTCGDKNARIQAYPSPVRCSAICMKLEEHAQLEIRRMLGHGPRGSHGRGR